MHLSDLATVKKKITTYKEADPRKQDVFLEQIAKISKKQLVYVDESGIHRNTTKIYGYCKKGEKLYGKVSGNRYVKRENFISGYVNGEIVAPWCYDGSCDKEFFEYWVEKALIPVLEEGMVVIMDNASFHKSEKVKKMIENAKCRLLFLPPYSPELNPIEKFWANLKKLVTKIAHKYKNFRDAINYAFRYYMIPN